MSESKLIELGYYDPSAKIRLSAYADTVVLDPDKKGSVICAIRFGGYPEMVRAMADAIYGGATIEATQNGMVRKLQSKLKGYQRQITHDGVYAVATLMAADDAQEETSLQDEDGPEDDRQKGDEEAAPQKPTQPRKCYIFCPEGDRARLFEELDHKTAAPLIPAFQDYVLTSLQNRGDLRQLEVVSQKERIDAWVLTLKPEDKNVVEVLEEGLKTGDIQIPGAVPGFSDGFENVTNVTEYLNAFGVTVADRIRNQFMPLFDPASEPLSDEVLAINDFITQHAGYSLYDAQLAVAEAVKRQLERKRAALIIAECGSGKTKIGSTALGALHGLWASQKKKDTGKSFNIIMCPSHVTKKWVREIGETLPDTYAMVVHSITDLNRLYAMYEQGDKSVYAVFSKERARDGYMRYPAVRWNRRRRAFLCPDCDAVIEMDISEDGISYTVPADQFFFLKENKLNHKCLHCGVPLWSAVNPSKQTEWVKIGEYGWVHRCGAAAHLKRTKNEKIVDQLMEIAQDPGGYYPVHGAQRRYPLSTYIKKKLRGKISGFLCDELHEYNNASGQGDAMAELYGTAKLFVGMTATLINGYSSGIFHLLYRIVPGLMLTRGAGVAAAVIVLSTVTANALGFHPIHAILQWAEGIVQVCINPSGTMELPDSTPSEYHSLAEALAQNGIDATGLPTWIPRDYSIYSITSKVSDGIVKCVAEFESNRGDLMMRVTSYAMENTIAVEERDESSRCYSKGNVDYYIISNNDQVKISWQIGLNAYVIGGQISENEAKEIIDSIT